MTRLAGITTLYALIAALLLVAPLSASQDPTETSSPSEEAAQPGGAAPEDGAPESPAPTDAPTPPEATAPGAAPPDAAPPEAPPPAESAVPQEVAPAQSAPAAGEAAPAAPPPAPAQPAASAPAADDPAAAGSDKRRKRRSGDAPRATAAADTSVTISDFEFAPTSVTVDVGDTVTWNNDGPTPHSATADDGDFDTGIFDAGQSRSHTFEQAGTFSYFCTPHPNMRGTITVRAASSGGESGGGEDSGTTGSTGGESGSADTGTDSSADSSGAALPDTGLDTGGLAVLGLMTLALGAWMRRRATAAR
jgi:LPXTG-motif cell wall-anchored protein